MCLVFGLYILNKGFVITSEHVEGVNYPRDTYINDKLFNVTNKSMTQHREFNIEMIDFID